VRFRTITASSMEAAMSELRATLGPDAIILNSACAENGNVSIRVAVENFPAKSHSETDIDQKLSYNFNIVETRDAYSSIESALTFHRGPDAVNAILLRTVDALGADDPVQSLAAALETRYSFSPIPLQPVRPILLLGPSGAGKTITAAKLAARSVLAEHETMLITTDLVRTGGAEQLAAYARSMNVPVFRAANEIELSGILNQKMKQ